mgnify:CR=1 FL=1
METLIIILGVVVLGIIALKKFSPSKYEQIKYNLNQHIYLFRLLHRSQSKIRKSIKYTIYYQK